MKFRAPLLLAGKTATGIDVPPEIVEALDAGRRPAVVVTIGSHSYRTTVATMGGVFKIPVSAQERQAAGISAGDELDVDVVLDTASRAVAPPADLVLALEGHTEARAFFDALPPGHQKAYVTWIESAKQDETRKRRVSQAVTMLREKRRR